jgi:6-phosphogluconolactonase
VERLEKWRLTLTLPVLNAAEHATFVVAGERKAEILEAVLATSADAPTYPAQHVHPDEGRLIWLVDAEAAGVA